VVETNGAKPEEIDKIEKDTELVIRLIAEQKLKVIASLQVLTRVGKSFTARTGQFIPIQTVALPVYTQTGATRDHQDAPRSQAFQGESSVSVPHIEYENPGLSVHGTSTRATNNLLDLNLKVELRGVDRSTGNFTPTFTQLSCAGSVRMKESETAVLMNAIQKGNRLRSLEEIAAGTGSESPSQMVIITTRSAH